jgi:hypothetical protein
MFSGRESLDSYWQWTKIVFDWTLERLLASGLVLINNGYVELIDGEASTQTKG